MKKPLLAAILAMSGLPLLAGPLFDGNGFAFGPRDCLHFSPSVSVGAFWETNARNTSHDTESGGGWRVQPSFSLSYAGKEGVKDIGSFSLSGFYSMERGFDSDNGQDSDSYGLSISTRRKLARNLTFSASASYSRSENDEFYGDTWNDYGIPRVDENRSESYNANAALGYQGDKWRWSAGLGWSRSKQLDGYKNESDSYSLSLTAGRAVFARHYWNLSFSTSWDDADDNSQAYYIRTGMSGSISKKLTYNALVGVGIYDYSGYEDDTAFGPSYDVSVAYKINRTFAASWPSARSSSRSMMATSRITTSGAIASLVQSTPSGPSAGVRASMSPGVTKITKATATRPITTAPTSRPRSAPPMSSTASPRSMARSPGRTICIPMVMTRTTSAWTLV